MSVDEMPDLKDLDDAAMEAMEVEGGAAPGGILAKLVSLHSPLLFAFSLACALTAWFLIPEEKRATPPTLDQLHSEAIHDIAQVKNPLIPMTEDQILYAIQRAEGDMSLIFRHAGYFDELKERPDLLNPYLLRAESLRLYAQRYAPEREERLADAVVAYGDALEWETRQWTPEEQEIYDAQFANPENTPKVIQARKNRRGRYIQYWQAVVNLELDRVSLARERMGQLLKEYGQETLTPLRYDLEGGPQPPSPKSRTLPPRLFELTSEDRHRIQYYLALAAERGDDEAEAEEKYRAFLMSSEGRSREYFLSRLSLGKMYLRRGGESMTRAGEGVMASAEDARQARRWFERAKNEFMAVVRASAVDELLREAYYYSGVAYLRMAETLNRENPRIWDRMSQVKGGLVQGLESFASSPVTRRYLPARTHHIPEAMARMYIAESLGGVTPTATLLETIPATSFFLTVKPRQSLYMVRADLLERARAQFMGATGSADRRFDGPAGVQIARALLAEGRLEDGRRKFFKTKKDFSDVEIEVACLVGEGRSYLLEGEIDRALVRFVGGAEKDGEYRLRPDDVEDWSDFCRSIVEDARNEEPSAGKRVWKKLSVEVRDIVRSIADTARSTQRQEQIISNGLNGVLGQRDFYTEESFSSIGIPREALALLGRNRDLLRPDEVVWLNRMLLDAAFVNTIIGRPTGTFYEPLPPAGELKNTSFGLVSEMEVIDALLQLSRRLVERAETYGVPDELREKRRSLEDAAQVYELLLANYHPDREEVLMETGQVYARLARLAIHTPDRARDLIARAARTYLRVAEEVPGGRREEEALLRSGRLFFAAGQYMRTIEAYSIFKDNYGKSDRIGEVLNLLGRSYRNMGLLEEAAETYRENVERALTPDSARSLYYLGWVLLEAGTFSKTNEAGEPVAVDVVGDPASPYARMEDGTGDLDVKTALQAFNEVRRLSRTGPGARPWQWATFDLGQAWYRIAERERTAEEASATEEDRAVQRDKYLPYYRKAEEVLREGLERYPLKDFDLRFGIDPQQKPEDYLMVRRLRLVNEYYLGRTLDVLARHGVQGRGAEARQVFLHVIDPVRYPDEMFEANPDAALYAFQPRLGVTDGPSIPPTTLRGLRKRAYLFLGLSYYEEGERLMRESPESPGLARNAFLESYRVYQRAESRLLPEDKPTLYYYMGEAQAMMGQREEAIRHYRLAVTEAEGLKGKVAATRVGPDFWGRLAQDRLRQLEQP